MGDGMTRTEYVIDADAADEAQCAEGGPDLHVLHDSDICRVSYGVGEVGHQEVDSSHGGRLIERVLTVGI